MAKIKICGITHSDDAVAAVAAGADAVGFVFYPKSSRYVAPEVAREIALKLGAFTVLTGLFVNATRGEINEVLARVPLHLLQFHGDETPEFCESFHRPYMKAIRMRPDINLADVFKNYASASAILLDAYKPGIPGGTGEAFDWTRVPKNPSIPVVLAGGLTSENVAQALAVTDVYAVDVSGGVEAAPGRKDREKIKRFIINARKFQ
jgi:phosphoribosylanthranilate isomerase